MAPSASDPYITGHWRVVQSGGKKPSPAAVFFARIGLAAGARKLGRSAGPTRRRGGEHDRPVMVAPNGAVGSRTPSIDDRNDRRDDGRSVLENWRNVLENSRAVAQLVEEHGGELTEHERRALIEQLQDPAARQELTEHVARVGRPESPEQQRRRPARRWAAAEASVAPVLPRPRCRSTSAPRTRPGASPAAVVARRGGCRR